MGSIESIDHIKQSIKWSNFFLKIPFPEKKKEMKIRKSIHIWDTQLHSGSMIKSVLLSGCINRSRAATIVVYSIARIL